MAEVVRTALVVASYRATPPPGVSAPTFAAAALSDTYEVLAGLDGVISGIVGTPEHEALLWPGSVLLTVDGIRAAADAVAAGVVVFVPADAPDLPQLVVAKVFKALVRAEVCVGPERGGDGVVALGVRLPWPTWLPADLALDRDPYPELARRVPDRRLLARSPDWHRLRSPAAVDRLDPGLEGWEETRALLSGRPLRSGPG